MTAKVTKGFACLDCSTLLETKLYKCHRCGSSNIKEVGVINVMLRMRSGIGIKNKQKIGKKPANEYVSRQQLGRNGKEAKVTIAVDRVKGTYFQHVEQQDENGNWKEVHHEEELLREHNDKKELTKIKTNNGKTSKT